MAKVFLAFLTVIIHCITSAVLSTPDTSKICKTEWFNIDDPSGEGDYEVFNHLYIQFPNRICLYPIACEVETTSGVPASQTGENIEPCNVARGFFCRNDDQSDQMCQDYRIRFTCPQSHCPTPATTTGNASTTSPGAGSTATPTKICKTEWFNIDDPSGEGDYEVFNHLYIQFPNRICLYPIACEVETTSGVPASQTGENIEPCNVAHGFFCRNDDQSDQMCQDYRIRFTCPQSHCPTPATTTGNASTTSPGAGSTATPTKICKTEWFNIDDPSGEGDYEVFNHLYIQFPNRICLYPIACEVETTSGVPASQTGENIEPCNVARGFFCRNDDQSDQMCQDYRIRFTCPQSHCPTPATTTGNASTTSPGAGSTATPTKICKTEWFNIDDPSGEGDYEVFNHLYIQFPNRICLYPIACEVETTSGVPASQTGENIEPCNVARGFFCRNDDQSDQMCQDYRIRFTCPQSHCPTPATTTGNASTTSPGAGSTATPTKICKTEWFNIDDPSGEGDYEVFNHLYIQFPNRICLYPIACEVETTSGVPASQTGENIEPCNVARGFFCRNDDQSDQMCQDYRIRFTCPQSHCPTPATTTGNASTTSPGAGSTATPTKICKTEWFNIDDPSGEGDYEVFNHLYIQFPNRICLYPIACEVETTSGVPASQTGENIEPCNVARGFFCRNDDQSDQMCQDYRIRFTCPQSHCPTPATTTGNASTTSPGAGSTATPTKICKTEWFNIDDPSGEGDYEVFNHLYIQFPNRICLYPIACEVETTSGVPASQTGENIEPCNVARGFFCRNDDQSDQMCQDYRIRFTCPQSHCPTPATTTGASSTTAPSEYILPILNITNIDSSTKAPSNNIVSGLKAA
ncbi:mucin-2-like [Mobula hypostoma]|uniref:mucin-2-like n=1 Tax=Mobula hypostoma TaxID=723540 RepID=UPI002FC34232